MAIIQKYKSCALVTSLLSLSVMLYIGLGATVNAADDPNPSICSKAFAKVLRQYAGSKAVEILSKAAKTPLQSYFSKTAEFTLPRGERVRVAKYTPENQAAFLHDVNALIAAKTNTLDFPLKKFQKWLMDTYNGSIPIPEPFVMHELLIKNKLTIGDYVDDLIHDFLQDTVKDLPANTYQRFIGKFKAAFDFQKDPIHARLWRLSKVIGTAIWATTIYTAILQLQGPISGFVGTVLSPINDYTSRLGNRRLSWIASLIQDKINKFDNPDVKELQEISNDLKSVEHDVDELNKYKFEGMSHADVKKVWDGFEKRFFDIAQHMGKLMNSDEASGRDIYLSRRLYNPGGYAQGLTIIRTNIEVTKTRIEKINEAIQKSSSHKATAEQQSELKEYNNILENDKRQMAVIISEWMLNKFFYPDSQNAKELNNSAADANIRYRNIDEYLGLPEVALALKDEIGIALSIVDGRLQTVQKSIKAR